MRWFKMTNNYNEFNELIKSRNLKLQETINNLNGKETELNELNREYVNAELTEKNEKANTIFAKIKKLEVEIEQLINRKQLIENTLTANDKELISIAEKLKAQNLNEMRNAERLKEQYKLNVATIEQKYRELLNNELKENGAKFHECESKINELANEILKVVEYTSSYSQIEKESIKKNGIYKILLKAGISM